MEHLLTKSPLEPLKKALAESLSAELRRMLVPITESLGVGVAYCWDSDIAGVMANRGSKTTPGTTWLTEPPTSHVNVFSLDLERTGQFPGQVFVFHEEGRDYMVDVVRHLVDQAIQYLDLARREEELLEELSSSWENLDAVY